MFFSLIFLYADSTPFRNRISKSARYGRMASSVNHDGAPKDNRSSSVSMAVRLSDIVFSPVLGS